MQQKVNIGIAVWPGRDVGLDFSEYVHWFFYILSFVFCFSFKDYLNSMQVMSVISGEWNHCVALCVLNMGYIIFTLIGWLWNLISSLNAIISYWFFIKSGYHLKVDSLLLIHSMETLIIAQLSWFVSILLLFYLYLFSFENNLYTYSKTSLNQSPSKPNKCSV